MIWAFAQECEEATTGVLLAEVPPRRTRVVSSSVGLKDSTRKRVTSYTSSSVDSDRVSALLWHLYVNRALWFLNLSRTTPSGIRRGCFSIIQLCVCPRLRMAFKEEWRTSAKEQQVNLRLETKSYHRTKESRTSAFPLLRKEKEKKKLRAAWLSVCQCLSLEERSVCWSAGWQANAQQHLKAESWDWIYSVFQNSYRLPRWQTITAIYH